MPTEIDSSVLFFCIIMGLIITLGASLPILFAIAYKEELICWLKRKGYLKHNAKKEAEAKEEAEAENSLSTG